MCAVQRDCNSICFYSQPFFLWANVITRNFYAVPFSYEKKTTFWYAQNGNGLMRLLFWFKEFNGASYFDPFQAAHFHIFSLRTFPSRRVYTFYSNHFFALAISVFMPIIRKHLHKLMACFTGELFHQHLTEIISLESLHVFALYKEVFTLLCHVNMNLY